MGLWYLFGSKEDVGVWIGDRDERSQHEAEGAEESVLGTLEGDVALELGRAQLATCGMSACMHACMWVCMRVCMNA